MTDYEDALLDWLFARPGQDSPGLVDDRFADAAAWLAAGRALPGVEIGLAAMLRGHADAVTRGAAALALGLLGASGARDTLIEALADDPLVAMEAAAALGRVGGSDAVEPLCAALREASANIRANAAAALVRIGGARAAECVATVRDDPDAMVRRAAAPGDEQE